MKISKLFITLLVLTLACSSDDNGNSNSQTQFTDSRDNQTYEIVTIGNQTWFAENLRFIPANTSSACYQDNPENCFIYGRWYRNDEAQTACPDGWHLPSKDEFLTLIDYVGGDNAATSLLIPGGSIQGQPVNFNLLSGGYHQSVNWLYITERAYLWSSDESEENPEWFNALRIIPNDDLDTNDLPWHMRLNCRCIKD